MTEKQKTEKPNASAILYDQSHGAYGMSMEQQREQAARMQAEKVREHAEWCKLPQSVRDAAANEDSHGPHVRDTSCDVKKPHRGR